MARFGWLLFGGRFGYFGKTAVNTEITPVITAKTAVITGKRRLFRYLLLFIYRGEIDTYFLSTMWTLSNGRGVVVSFEEVGNVDI